MSFSHKQLLDYTKMLQYGKNVGTKVKHTLTNALGFALEAYLCTVFAC